MFSNDFQGFLLAHKSVYGPHKGVESHAVPLIEPVPYGLLESQQQIAMEMDEETRLAAFRRQLDEITDMLRKRKRAVDMRGGKKKRRRQHYEDQKNCSAWASAPWHKDKTWEEVTGVRRFGRRVQACLLHNPEEQRYCRDESCRREHIDTLTTEGSRRWQRIQQVMGENARSGRDNKHR